MSLLFRKRRDSQKTTRVGPLCQQPNPQAFCDALQKGVVNGGIGTHACENVDGFRTCFADNAFGLSRRDAHLKPRGMVFRELPPKTTSGTLRDGRHSGRRRLRTNRCQPRVPRAMAIVNGSVRSAKTQTSRPSPFTHWRRSPFYKPQGTARLHRPDRSGGRSRSPL